MTFTEQQQRAIKQVGDHLCVDAGAGSGKTRVLVARIMNLLEGDADLDRIVAITFTRKAAAEMKERLRKAIHDRPREISGEEMDVWRDREYRVDNARITTIDSFCSGILRENALRAGIDPDFAVLADAEAALLRADVVAATLDRLLDDGHSETHRLVVEHGLTHVRDLFETALALPAAMANASKRYAGLEAPEILEIWNADTERIERERLAHLRSSSFLDEFIRQLEAFDGACDSETDKCEAARRNAVLYIQTLVTAEPIQDVRVAFRTLAAINLQGGSQKAWGGKETLAGVKDVLRRARDLAQEYKLPEPDLDVEQAAAERTRDLIAVWDSIYSDYATAKSTRTALDFSDLLAMTEQLLRDHPAIRRRVANGIDHLLIDEFQDTNLAQLSVAECLIRTGQRHGAELFVVGDAKQSIYRFRGAEVDVFERAKQLAEDTLPLDRNFRSVSHILAFVNDFFATSGLLRNVEPQLKPLTPHRDGFDGVHIEFLVPESHDGANADDDRAAEADLIADRVAALCRPGGVAVHDDATDALRPAEFGDVALLFRKGTKMDLYEDALRNRGIPANVVEGAGFYKRQEILDLQNLLTVVTDPWNEFALAALLRSPLVGVSDDTLMTLRVQSTLAQAVWNALPVADTGENERLNWARELVDAIRKRSEWPLPALLRYVLAKTGYEAILLAQHHGVQKASNLRKLVDLAENFSHTGRAHLAAFAAYLSTVARRELREGDAELFAAQRGAVTLMTVHKSKGLEFPIVVLADTSAAPGGGRMPTVCHAHARLGLAAVVHDGVGETKRPVMAHALTQVEADEADAEEARVLYVAMTRARDHLLISGSPAPKKASWLAALDAAHHITERAHDTEICGKDWVARVCRKLAHLPTPAQAMPKKPAPAAALDSLEAQTRPLGVNVSAVPSLAVSDLLGLLRPDAGEPSTLRRNGARHGILSAALRGEAAHRLMEQWDFSGPPPVESVAAELCPAPDLQAACVTELRAIADRVQRSQLWSRLKTANRLERELPFVYALDGVRVNGKIDVLIDREVLVDYKTGERRDDQHAQYETQLRLYAAAIGAITGQAPREALLHYLDIGETHPVDVRPEAVHPTIDRLRRELQTTRP